MRYINLRLTYLLTYLLSYRIVRRDVGPLMRGPQSIDYKLVRSYVVAGRARAKQRGFLSKSTTSSLGDWQQKICSCLTTLHGSAEPLLASDVLRPQHTK